MGQTLTHGIYLPDEGERNCYDGLASNWSILDGAVGTVAEHTTQIAGKAPAVHTHTKSDITDFPAYGNAAGTICEGNDSRLSDARTPVAHTHTKSDVTDLFNSVNTWAENNRFYKNSALSDITSYADTSMAFTGNSNTILFNTRGSSNYQSYGTFLFAGYMTGSSPDRYGQLKLVRSTDIKGDTYDGYKPDTSFNLWRLAPHYLLMDIMEAVRIRNDGTNNYIAPIATNATNLGTSTNKWKTLNGINPGALSLPNLNSSDSNQWIDLSGNITQLTGGDNWYYPTLNGWVFVITRDNPVSLNVLVLGAVNSGKLIAGAAGVLEASSGAMWVSAPAPAGSRVRIRANNGSTGAIEAAWFITCQGNV